MTTNVPIQTSSPVAHLLPGQSNVTSYRKAAIIAGLIQIGLSALSFAFGVACIFSHDFAGYIAVPVWGALGSYLVAGCLGVVAGYVKERNACIIVACLVMSILAAVTALAHATIGSISTAMYHHYYYPDGWYAVNILSVLVGVIELATAIVASVLMCCEVDCHHDTCCSCLQQQPIIVGQPQYTPYVLQTGQVFNQGQVVAQGYQQQPSVGHSVAIGQSQVVGEPYQPQVMGQPRIVGQPQVIGQSHVVGQPHAAGQPQVTSQSQIVGQPPAVGHP